jgi:hypothetical protein
MGTHWELERNTLGTKGKKIPQTPPPNIIEKKSRHFECMLSFPLVP